MTARIVEIAEAVKNELNSGSWPQNFIAERRYHPVFKLADMEALHVTVMPRAQEQEPLSRGDKKGTYKIDVAVQKRFQSEVQDFDALLEGVEAMISRFYLKPLPGLPGVFCKTVENDPVFDPEHLEKYRQFTSVVTFGFETQIRG